MEARLGQVAQKLCRAIDLKNGAIRNMEIEALVNSGHVSLCCSWDTPDTNTGQLTRIFMVKPLPLYANSLDSDETAHFICGELYDLVRSAYAHEAAEAFVLGGVRIFDPHRQERGETTDYPALVKQATGTALAAPEPAQKALAVLDMNFKAERERLAEHDPERQDYDFTRY
jgi:hypothetical protein